MSERSLSERITDRPIGNRIPLLCLLLRSNWADELWGSELSTIDLLNNLKTQGVDPILVDNSPSVARHRGASFGNFEAHSVLRGPLRIISKSLQTIRIFRAQSCKAVFLCTNYWSEANLVALLTSALLRKPLIVVVRDRFMGEEDSVPFVRLLLSSFVRLRSCWGVIDSLARRMVVRRADVCIVPSLAVGNLLSSAMHAKRCAVIRWGIDQFWFEAPQMEKKSDAAYVGRLSRAKGAHVLIQAWKEVKRRIPDATLVIIGTGPEYPALKRLVEELELVPNVLFRGYLNDPSKVRFELSNSRIFVLPSRREGFSRATSEAIACGVPCVVTDLPELRQLYDGVAVFVPEGDPESLASSIVRLLENDSLREELSKKGTISAKRFLWEEAARLTSFEIRRVVR